MKRLFENKKIKQFIILYGILLFLQIFILPYLLELIGHVLGRNEKPSFYLFGWHSVLNNDFLKMATLLANIWLIIGIGVFSFRDGVSFNIESGENKRPKSSGTSEYGSAREQTLKEMRINYSEYTVGEDLKTKVFKDKKRTDWNGGMVLHAKKKGKYTNLLIDREDVHSIVIGTTGSGKTRRLVMPTAEVLSNAGESMIFTDPKGELYQSLGGFLEHRGYNVVLLDFRDTDRGNQWNILELVNEYMDQANENIYLKASSEFLINVLKKYQNGEKSINDVFELIESFVNEEIKELRDAIFRSENIKTRDWKNYKTAQKTLELLQLLNNSDYDHQENLFVIQKSMIDSYNRMIESYKAEAMNDDFKKIYYEEKIKELEKDIQEVKNLKTVEGKPLLTYSFIENYLDSIKLEAQIKIDLYEAKAFEAANDIAHVLVFGKETERMTERIWLDGQKSLIASLILFVSRESTNQNARHMGSVYQLLAEYGVTLKGSFMGDTTYLDKLMEDLPPHDICKKALAPLRVAGDKMKSSFLGSATTTLSLFADPNIVEMTSKTTVKFDTIATEPTAVFLVIPDERDTRDFLPVLFIDQAYTKFVDIANAQPNNRLSIRVNCILDEFGNMPAFNSFTKKLTVSRSRGIRWFLIIQDFRQLQAQYKDDEKTIKSNAQWIYLLTTDSKTAEDISKRCGTYTTLVENRSKSASEINKLSYSASLQLQKRELYLPDELLKFKMGEALVLTPRLNPAKTNLLDISEYPFYEEMIQLQIQDAYERRPKTSATYFIPDHTEYSATVTAFNSGLLFYDVFLQKVVMRKQEEKPMSEVVPNEYSDEELQKQIEEARQKTIDKINKKNRQKNDVSEDDSDVLIKDEDENNDNDDIFDDQSFKDVLTDELEFELVEEINEEQDEMNAQEESKEIQSNYSDTINSASSEAPNNQKYKNDADLKRKQADEESKRKEEIELTEDDLNDLNDNLQLIDTSKKQVIKDKQQDVLLKLSNIQGLLKVNKK